MPTMYTTTETAEIFKVKEPTIRAWIRIGKLKASRVGGNKNVRITEDSINEFMRNTEIEAQKGQSNE